MPQKFASIMQANQIVSEAKEKVKINQNHVYPRKNYFLANHKLQTLFSKIQDLGSIWLGKRLELSGRQYYPVKVKSDSETCHIISACTLNDNSIILADSNNKKLKCIDSSSYTVKAWCEIPQRPLQVCAITDTEVAVSCSDSQIIQFVNVGKTMKMTRQIKTCFKCRGLAYANVRLYVSDDTSVYMFSLSGEQLTQFRNNLSGQRLLYSGIQALAINRNMIYVSDSKNGLIIVDMSGQLVGQYKGDKLRESCSICLFNNESVLVCGRDSRNVLQFSPDGKLIGQVLTSGELCRTVCCDKNKKSLIVSFSVEDYIQVYDIIAE